MPSPSDAPDPDEITLEDARRNGWPVLGHCEACRALHAFVGHERLTAPQALTPIAKLFKDGQLVCRTHRAPFAGVAVDGGGNLLMGWTYVARFYRPGCWPDPDQERGG